jgi:hypothetical protein
MVVDLVAKFGPKKWSQIAGYLKGRIGKQCRERCVSPSSPAYPSLHLPVVTEWLPTDHRSRARALSLSLSLSVQMAQPPEPRYKEDPMDGGGRPHHPSRTR